MPTPLRKLHEGLNLPEAQDQARMAIRRAIEIVSGASKPNRRLFTEKLNEELRKAGREKEKITYQAVQWWESEGTFVDPVFWGPIETLTDYRVTRVHLAPQVYGIGGWRIDLPYAPL